MKSDSAIHVIIAGVLVLNLNICSSWTLADEPPPQTKSSPMEKMDSKKRKASEDEKVVEKKAKASPAK